MSGTRAPSRCVRLRIVGRVQGVGYRAWAVRQAIALGLRGWVRNRTDGSVEAVLIGEDASVVAMLAACRVGPPGANVSDIATRDVEDDAGEGFIARPTA